MEEKYIKNRQYMKSIILFLGILFMPLDTHAKPVNGWDYQYETRLAGTKSESIVGKLLYDGIELPKEFERVITPVGEFTFVSVMGWSGVQVKWTPMITTSSGTVFFALTDAEIKRLMSGNEQTFRKCPSISEKSNPSNEVFIKGKFEERPKGVGPDWFYVVKQGWWVNPKKATEALKNLPK